MGRERERDVFGVYVKREEKNLGLFGVYQKKEEKNLSLWPKFKNFISYYIL